MTAGPRRCDTCGSLAAYHDCLHELAWLAGAQQRVDAEARRLGRTVVDIVTGLIGRPDGETANGA